jgi:dihydrofolate reductase
VRQAGRARDDATVRAAERPAALTFVLIAAVAENGVIGRGGEMPWRLKSDLQHFRRTTMGKPIVMGRRTYQSLFKPLVGRTTIVVTRDRDFAAPGVVVAHSLEAALAAARGDALRRGTDTIMLAGGGELYGQTIGAADRLLITLVHARPAGDVTFPPIDPARWREVERTEHAAGAGDSAGFARIEYRRAGGEVAGGASGSEQSSLVAAG